MKQNLLFVLIIVLITLFAGITYNSVPKTAFVDSQQLFDSFQGRKELESNLKKESNKRKAVLDSLGLQIKSMQQTVQNNPITKRRLQNMIQQYQQMAQEQERYYQYKSQEYTEAIWKQISQYTKEYGEENSYDYIFGVAGSGSLMFGKPHYDITESVTKFINSKYAGN